jgi:hypothetical protein
VAWLERGVHIKAVADLLGHSSIAITGDVYGHTWPVIVGAANPGWRMRWRIGPKMVPRPVYPAQIAAGQSLFFLVGLTGFDLRPLDPQSDMG